VGDDQALEPPAHEFSKVIFASEAARRSSAVMITQPLSTGLVLRPHGWEEGRERWELRRLDIAKGQGLARPDDPFRCLSQHALQATRPRAPQHLLGLAASVRLPSGLREGRVAFQSASPRGRGETGIDLSLLARRQVASGARDVAGKA